MTRNVKRGGHYLELTAREFEFLEYLLHHKEQVVSREMLARYVWKETARAFDRKLIHAVRGVGFVLREEP